MIPSQTTPVQRDPLYRYVASQGPRSLLEQKNPKPSGSG
jgi:hypothetical protein